MAIKIQILKGMKDVLPGSTDTWQDVEELLRKYAHLYGYSEIRTPVLEHTELFSRGVGDFTDIVQKEMYTFEDKGGRSVSLKPEGTAGTVRSFIENSMYAETLPCKLYYLNTPIFRYEAPQAGRLREHHQFGIECFGSKEATIDSEIISLGYIILKELGLKNIKAQVNNIGCSKCRPVYINKLKEYLKSHENVLCHDCQNRLEKNTLRVLDCKEEKCQQIVSEAPSILDYLCDECENHFNDLKKWLELLNIPFEVNDKIVRGLDYYTKTVFEFVQYNDSNKLTVCGGGRYDNLINDLSGIDVPAVGFGMGIERLLMFIQTYERRFKSNPDFFIANITKDDLYESYKLLNLLRENNIKSEINHMQRSLKAQFKYANKINAKYILLVGGEELKNGYYKLRNLETKEETNINKTDILTFINNMR